MKLLKGSTGRKEGIEIPQIEATLALPTVGYNLWCERLQCHHKIQTTQFSKEIIRRQTPNGHGYGYTVWSFRYELHSNRFASMNYARYDLVVWENMQPIR